MGALGGRIADADVPQALGKPLPSPDPRSVSGTPRAETSVAADSLEVVLTYNAFDDPKPPAGVKVTLVGYTDDAVKVETHATDKRGRTTFSALDRSGATAYYAMALLPRNRAVDRLISSPIVLDGTSGAHVVLSGDARTATAKPVDDMEKLGSQAGAVAAGTIRVSLEGEAEANDKVSLVDATTGKVVASRALAGGKTVDLATGGRQLVYAEVVSKDKRYRSLPVQPVPGRGTNLSVYVYPRMMFGFELEADVVDGELTVRGRFNITNYAWAPAPVGGAGLVLPLPHGSTDAAVADEDGVEVTATGFRIGRPVPPGGMMFHGAFNLPIVGGLSRWVMDLPYGLFNGGLAVLLDGGVTVDVPAGTTTTKATTGAGTYSLFSDITFPPNQTLTLTVHAPPPPPLSPAAAALAKACGPLHATRHHALEGKPAIDFTARQLDGAPFQLASLRGKLVVLNFTASWNSISKPELASFPALVKALGNIAVVVVTSDANPHDIEPLVDKAAGYRVVLDPPATDETIGPVTRSYGTTLLPETYLIDRTGTVRYYIVNTRDWSSPEAIACLKALAK